MSSESVAQSLFSWLDEAGNQHSLDVDVVMSATDKRNADLTDHVVEDGAVITDHVIIQPEALSLELLVTQTPVNVGGAFGMADTTVTTTEQKLTSATVPIKVRPSQFQPGGFLLLSTGLRSVVASVFGGASGLDSSFQGSTAEQISSTVQARTLQTEEPVDRVGDAHDALIEILTKALLVTISFKGRLYIDYLLTGVELQQQAGQFGLGRFQVSARAFRTVTGVAIKLPDPADFRALPAVKKGNKPANKPDPDPSKRARSFAKRGANGVDEAVDKLGKLFGFGGQSRL